MKHFILALLLIAPGFAVADGDFTITWPLPTEREDGTPLLPSEIDHYEVYMDGALFGPVQGGTNTTFTGTTTVDNHCFAQKTFDTSGVESAFSNEVCILIVSNSPPNAPVISVTSP